jgi:hypothetical protein
MFRAVQPFQQALFSVAPRKEGHETASFAARADRKPSKGKLAQR